MHDLKTIESALSVIDFARDLPIDMLTEGRSPTLLYPTTVGEHIVSYVLGILLPYRWSDDGFDSLANELIGPLSQLDMGVNKEADWQELFTKATQVKKAIEQ